MNTPVENDRQDMEKQGRLRRHGRWLGRSLLATLAIGVGLLVLIVLLVTTPWGGRWLVDAAERWAPIDLRVGRTGGTLSGTLDLDDVRIRTDSVDIRVDRLRISLQPMDLLADRLSARRVVASSVSVRWSENPEPAAEWPKLPPAPLDVTIEQLRVSNLILHLPSGAALQLDRIEGRSTWDAAGLRLDPLRLDREQAWLEGEGLRLDASDQSIHGVLRAELTPPDVPPVRISVTLSGSVERPGFALETAEPWAVTGEGWWSTADNAGEINARYVLELARLGEGWPSMQVSGQIRAQALAGVATVGFDLSSDAESPWLSGWRARGEVRTTAESIELPELVFSMPFLRDGWARGRIGTASGRPVTIESGWASAAVPAEVAMAGRWQELRLGRGRVKLEGPTVNPRITISADSAIEHLPGRGEISAVGTLSPGELQVEIFRVTAGDGALAGSGRLVWSDPSAGLAGAAGKHLVAEVSAHRFDPSVVFPEWPGNIEGTVSLQSAFSPIPSSSPSGSPAARSAAAPASVLVDLGGTLRGRPLRLRGSGRTDAGGFEVLIDEGRFGSSRVHGRVGRFPAWDTDFAATGIQIADWLPGWQGEADATIRITGQADNPRFDVAGHVRGLAGTGLPPTNLDLDLSGRQDKHRARLQWASSSFSGRAILGGNLGTTGLKTLDRRYAFHIDGLDVSTGSVALALAGPASGEWTPDDFEVEPLCLQGEGTTVCAEAASNRPPGVRAELRFDARGVPLSAFPFPGSPARQPGSEMLQGRFDAQFGLQWLQAGGWRAGPAQMDTTVIRLTVQDEANSEETADHPGWEIPPLRVRVIPADEDHFEVTLVSSGDGPPSIDAKARIVAEPGDWKASVIEGEAEFDLGDFEGLDGLLPEIRIRGGHLSGRARVSGRLGSPQPQGVIVLAGGDVQVPEAGVRLKSVDARLELPPPVGGAPPGARLTLQGLSGKGRFALEGRVRAIAGGSDDRAGDDRAGDDLKRYDGELHLTGENVDVARTDSVELAVSPDLWLRLASGRLSLEGQVDVQRARVVIRAQPRTAVRVSADERIVPLDGNDTQPYPLQRRLDVLDVRVRLGEDARFSGYGLDTPLTGSLRLRQNEGRTTANGSIRTRTGGRYSAWGQTLDIREGRLFWSDTALTQPALDVEAIRSPVPEVTVGLIARGPLARPRLELFSSPDMGQSDQLSWLLFGRPMQAAPTAGQTSLLDQAAATLGIGAGNLLARRFGDRLPVNVGIEVPAGQTQESAALVVGRYLTPDLYVSYGISILERLSTLRIEYALSPAFKVVTETSGEHNAADVYVTVERP